MFSRIQYENWHLAIPVAAFFLTFAVFLYFTIRALRMQTSQLEALSRLPLANDDEPNHA